MGVKRRAPAAAVKAVSGASKRAKPNSVPKRKSKDASDDEGSEHQQSSSSQQSDLSSYDDEDVKSESEEEEPSSVSEEEDSDVPKKKRRVSQAGTSASKKASKATNKETQRAGKTGLGPGTQVISKRPRARSPGDTPYQDDRIHMNTLLFLGDLGKNNNREWLKSHDLDYRASFEDWKSYVDCLTERITGIDELIPELPFKDLNFRIYRDVRFSKSKVPYKTAFGAAWSRTGRKGPYACYYIQVKPGRGSLVAGGLWQPEAAALAKIRREIDRRPERLKAVLAQQAFRNQFLDKVSNDEKKAVAKFVAHNQESALKTKPKGYDPDHKDLALLRLRSFTVSRKLEDDEVTGPRSLERIGELVSALEPLVTYLNSIVMPDDPSEDEDDDDAGETDGDSD